MNKLEKRGERLARARQQIAIERIAAALKEELRGARIEIDQSSLRISGAGLVKRWLSDSSLRFVAGLIK